MTTTGWIELLSVTGGLAQIVGVGLVIRDLGADRRKASRLVAERPERTTTDWMYLQVYGTPLAAAVKGRATDDQVRVIAERVDTIERRMQEGVNNVSREIDERMEAALRAIDGQVHKVNDELQQHIREILTGNLSTRLWGVGLIVVGIVLSATADFIGA